MGSSWRCPWAWLLLAAASSRVPWPVAALGDAQGPSQAVLSDYQGADSEGGDECALLHLDSTVLKRARHQSDEGNGEAVEFAVTEQQIADAWEKAQQEPGTSRVWPLSWVQATVLVGREAVAVFGKAGAESLLGIFAVLLLISLVACMAFTNMHRLIQEATPAQQPAMRSPPPPSPMFPGMPSLPGMSGGNLPPFLTQSLGGREVITGGIVPAGRRFRMRIPSLMQFLPRSTNPKAKGLQVLSGDGVELFALQLVCFQPNPYESVLTEEVISVHLGGTTDGPKLLEADLGRYHGPKMECVVKRPSPEGLSRFFGILAEAFAPDASKRHYVFQLASGRDLYRIEVEGELSERKIQVYDAMNDTSIAATDPNQNLDIADTSKEYEVDCFPHTDTTLVLIALAGIERLDANSMVNST